MRAWALFRYNSSYKLNVSVACRHGQLDGQGHEKRRRHEGLMLAQALFSTDTRPARGNTRTKLGNMDRLLGLILAQILSLALPLAGLTCLSNNDASACNKHIHVGIVYSY